MGTSLELNVRADDAASARRAEARVLREIDRLAKIFSGYDRTSEFRRWQDAPRGPMPISAELFELLRACDDWRGRSGGAFDPRVEVLTRLWKRCASEGRRPSDGEIADAKTLMGRPAWRLDSSSSSAERLSDCPLTFDAIAKGYIVERACAVALDPGRGVRGLLLNVGGDMRVCGEPSRTIGIVNPFADSESSEPLTYVEVKDRAVATSGSSQRGFRIDGKWYSHVFDPRSGLPADKVASATVIAERSADADALDTILNVLAPADGLRLVASIPGAECLIVAADGRIVRSEGWKRHEKARPAPAALADAGGSWGDEYELVVNFEINRPDTYDGPYRRPYVVVWAEDKDGTQVRVLSLWISSGGAGPYPWLPDLKRWYRSEEARAKLDNTDLISAISRPTRPAGKYKVIWDGKDNKGKPVPHGEYTINVEAAREHGTYQNIRKKVNLDDKPFAEELKGNVEIKSAGIEYRRKGPAK
jgi:thiamine biosynthesis lipoprotein ApbE